MTIDNYELQELSQRILLAGISSGQYSIAAEQIDIWTKFIVSLAKSLLTEVEAQNPTLAEQQPYA